MIGIIGAMQEEVAGIVALLNNVSEKTIGNRIYYSGTICNQKCTVVFSRWGKVAAATTATALIMNFNVSEIIFVGVAGAINQNLKIGDIIIGNRLIQHDFDSRPMLEEFEIPLLKKKFFDSNPALVNIFCNVIKNLISQNEFTSIINCEFPTINPKLFIGDIASGDKFFANDASKKKLTQKLPSILCVEMEGAAVAQICYEYDIPFVVIRTISDNAGDNSSIDFNLFIKNVASIYSTHIVENYIKSCTVEANQ